MLPQLTPRTKRLKQPALQADRLTRGMKMLYKSRAPVRIDLAGGWTDTPPFSALEGGAVVNLAIRLYTHCRLTLRPEAAGITIVSLDLNQRCAVGSVERLEYDGTCDLAKAAVRRLGAPGGVELVTRSEAPAGSGLGTSAALGVSVIGALSRALGGACSREETAELARDIELLELGIWCGKQDHYASALGGLNFMLFNDPLVKIEEVAIPADARDELFSRMVLAYTGRSRLSGNIHANVVSEYRHGARRTVNALRRLRGIALEMREALSHGDLSAVCELLWENWARQADLHPSVTTPELASLIEVGRVSGAQGGKACGAGGGGCLLFVAREGEEGRLAEALRGAGAQILEVAPDYEGLSAQELTVSAHLSPSV